VAIVRLELHLDRRHDLTPLLGDPLSRFALPSKPDLAVAPADIYLNSKSPTPADSVLYLTALVHNYGLVLPTASRYC